jgi:hypothetical protein
MLSGAQMPACGFQGFINLEDKMRVGDFLDQHELTCEGPEENVAVITRTKLTEIIRWAEEQDIPAGFGDLDQTINQGTLRIYSGLEEEPAENDEAVTTN